MSVRFRFSKRECGTDCRGRAALAGLPGLRRLRRTSPPVCWLGVERAGQGAERFVGAFDPGVAQRSPGYRLPCCGEPAGDEVRLVRLRPGIPQLRCCGPHDCAAFRLHRSYGDGRWTGPVVRALVLVRSALVPGGLVRGPRRGRPVAWLSGASGAVSARSMWASVVQMARTRTGRKDTMVVMAPTVPGPGRPGPAGGRRPARPCRARTSRSRTTWQTAGSGRRSRARWTARRAARRPRRRLCRTNVV